MKYWCNKCKKMVEKEGFAPSMYPLPTKYCRECEAKRYKKHRDSKKTDYDKMFFDYRGI